MGANISDNISTVMKEMLTRCDGISTCVAMLILGLVGGWRVGSNLYQNIDSFQEWKIAYICFGFIPITFLIYIDLIIFGNKESKINRVINSALVLLIPLIILKNFL